MKHPALKILLPIVVAVLVLVGAVAFVGYKVFLQQPGWPTSSHFSLAEDPTTINWNFPAVTNDADTVERQIERIKNTSDIDAYEKAISLGEEYRLLGEGDKAYTYILQAVDLEPNKSLPYLNLGTLLEKVGALDSARSAYERAVTVEPQYENNHANLVQFYMRYYPNDTKLIEATFKNGLEHTGNNETLLKNYAQWLSGEKRYKEAIVIWQQILKDYAPANAEAIRQEISRLQRLQAAQ